MSNFLSPAFGGRINDEGVTQDQGFIGKMLIGDLTSNISSFDPGDSYQEGLGLGGPGNPQK
jgi:hypothetical protein